MSFKAQDNIAGVMTIIKGLNDFQRDINHGSRIWVYTKHKSQMPRRKTSVWQPYMKNICHVWR